MADSQASAFRFEDFVVDVVDRQLWRGGTRIDLSSRYFDALVLLVRKHGRLVDKDQFFDEVWDDVVVSDSALAQCIKEIRRQLGDDASEPRFVQTVSGHGYRFIAEVETLADGVQVPAAPPATDPAGDGAPAARIAEDWRLLGRGMLAEWGAGTLGGGLAGLAGGLLYGYGIAAANAEVGTLSVMLVLIALNMLVGLAGGFGVSLGLAGAYGIASYVPGMRVVLRILGAAFGGLVVGAAAKLIGVDAFNVLFGRAPAGITGGPEGAVLGAALATGAYAGNRLGARSGREAPWHAVVGAAGAGAIAGALIPLAGGRLMGGSLDLLARSFAESRLHLDTFGALFGEVQFGLAPQVMLAAVEGLLFGAGVVGVLAAASRIGGRNGTIWRL